MKKSVILLLTIFTISATALCGCADMKENSNYDDKVNTENVQLREVEENDGQDTPECPEEDGECPQPRMPHKKHNKKLPRPKPAYHK